jgi:hypothetical protein
LSEPEVYARQLQRRYRYRLLTVGAALTWAKRGFDDQATPLDAPLVNHDRPRHERTLWANVYASWDPVPHGPAPAAEFSGWTAWAEGPPGPNRMVRNLGAPVPAEHGEYWRNQQEFVPLLVRAIDPDVAWADRDAGPEGALWSNCRLALLSALVRARLVVLALPVAALITVLRGRRFIHCDSGGAYRSTLTDALGALARRVAEGLLGAEVYASLRDALCATPLLAGLLVVAAVALAAYALMDLYTNVCWASLGRRAATLRPLQQPPPRFSIPGRSALLVWLPTLILLPALLWPFHFGRTAWLAVTVTNTLIAVCEVFWLNVCLRAFREPVLRRVCAAPFGRQRPAAQVRTPAGPAAVPVR